MEREIGEIFEYNGEWYQCIIGNCNQCSFDEAGTCKFIGNPYCAYRNDKKLSCFKKLEKVGCTYAHNSVIVQKYRIIATPVIMPDEPYMYFNAINNTIDIEIKQNKEDMEEKLNKEIDWEERRYEIAKTAIHAQISGPIIPGIDPNPSIPDLAKWAINIADALIAELKKGGKDEAK